MTRSGYTRRAFVAGIGATTCIPLFNSRAATTQAKFRLGVNIAGAEFDAKNGRWVWPSTSNIQYYIDKGFNIFRFPFRWERLQPTLSAALDETAMAGLDTLVQFTTSRGAITVLDAHNFGRREGAIIGADPNLPIAAFADFWGQMAARYRANDQVWFNLMNEPYNVDITNTLQMQNAACAAIRRNGARSKVLFSGISYSGAHSWLSSGNGRVFIDAHDPAGNFAFDMHQYLDSHYGGSSPDAVPGIGRSILESAYEWAKRNDLNIFLGEFATGPSPASVSELKDLLEFMICRQDVFIGGTYWAGGGVWGKNIMSADPVDGDKPQTLLLQHYLTAAPSCPR